MFLKSYYGNILWKFQKVYGEVPFSKGKMVILKI